MSSREYPVQWGSPRTAELRHPRAACPSQDPGGCVVVDPYDHTIEETAADTNLALCYTWKTLTRRDKGGGGARLRVKEGAGY